MSESEPSNSPKNKGGRPSPYEGRKPEIIQEVASRLKTGEPLAQICRENNMPDPDTIRSWMGADTEVSRLIARAREDGFDVIAAECLTIADDGSNDVVTDKDGNEHVNTEVIQRSKLRVETRLKLLAKWDPKRYGDTAPIQTVNVGVAVNTMTEDRRKELLDKKRAAVEYRRAKPITVTNGSNGNGTNGHSNGNGHKPN